MPPLKNKKHEFLCQEYMIDLNQTQAAIRAGYSPKSANQQAARLFAKASICARVDELQAQRSRRCCITADRVLNELARVAFLQPGDVLDLNTGAVKDGACADDLAAIAAIRVKKIPTAEGEGVEREVRIVDKLKALELMGRHLGMFNDRLKVSGALPVIITGEDALAE